MKRNTIFSVIIALVLFFALFVPSFAEENRGDIEFTGTRTIEFVADTSDIENFINGGRFEFEKALRILSTDDVKYSCRTEGRDYHITFNLKFDSFEQYKKGLSVMLSYEPLVVYDSEDSIVLIEGFESSELLRFIQYSIDGSSNFEKDIKEIFSIKKNSIMLNGKSYECGNRISILPDDRATIKMDYLSIKTTTTDGFFDREITAGIRNEQDDSTSIDKIERVFGKQGEVKVSEGYDMSMITVIFSQCTQSQLISKTMACLSVAVSISEEKSYLNNDNIYVTRREFIDVESLKKSDDFVYSYEYVLPEYNENISVSEGTEYIDGIISSKNDTVIFNYEQPFAFSEIKISTQMTNMFLKKNRVIDFPVPIYLANSYHEKIKRNLESRLCRGVVFDIYDENGIRHYKLTFSSYFMKDIEEFTETILGGDNLIAVEIGILPFNKTLVNETIHLRNPMSKEIQFNDVRLEYIVFSLGDIVSESDYTVDKDKYTTICFTQGEGNKITYTFEFFGLNIVKVVISMLIIVILIVLIIIIKKCTKKLAEKTNKKEFEKTITKEGIQSQNKVCSSCNAIITPNEKFCRNCGTKIQ